MFPCFHNIQLCAEGCLWQVGKHRKQTVHEHSYMHVCLRLWKYDHVKRMCHLKKFKKTDLWTPIVRLKQRKKAKIVLFIPLWRGIFPGNVKQMHFNAAHDFLAHECSGHCSRLCCPALPYSSLPHGPTVHLEYQRSQGDTKPLGAWCKAERQSTERATAVSAARQLLQPQTASLGRTSERKSTPAPLATWILIAFSCRDPKYLCKQHVQIVTHKCKCDTFMKYANMMCWAMIWSECVFESLSHALVHALKISDSLFKVNRANLSAWFITSTSDKYDLSCSSLVCF